MKRGLVASYLVGITDLINGESYWRIMRLFVPEFITSLLLYSVPVWIDGYLVGRLESALCYSTLGTTNNFLHFFIKIAEAFSVATIIVSGKSNGSGSYKEAGDALKDSFWLTCVTGGGICCLLYTCAHVLYTWYLPSELISLGVPYLRLRVISIFLMFVFFAFAGFLKGLKDTKGPMLISIVGIGFFIIFDYSLVLGRYGLPALGLYGSAVASIVQYSVMVLAIIWYVIYSNYFGVYNISLFSHGARWQQIRRLFTLSFPIMIDKGMIAFAYLWLCYVIKPLGIVGISTFCLIKDMERFALVPAIAFAQVITLLASNDYGSGRFENIKSNIKKVFCLASIIVGIILIYFSLFSRSVMYYFDRKAEFTDLAASIFPIISVLVFFDVLQLILSGAFRGISQVTFVMMVRSAIIMGFFIPVSYGISCMPIDSVPLKMVCIYASFYIGNCLMSLLYINKFRSDGWRS